MMDTWLVVVPPLIVVLLATVTRRILFSLIMGIASAALIIHQFQPWSAVTFAFSRLLAVSELGKLASWKLFWTGSNLFICAFLIILGILITMIHDSGAAYAYGNAVSKRISTRQGAERASLLLSMLFFIDDYFGCLTVGSVMQSITDRFKVPRVKLALLVNAVAAPLAVIVPLSSWVAEIVGQLRNSGVSSTRTASTIILTDPLYLYTACIPFMLYAFIVIVSLWYMVSMRVSYGLLGRHERIAQTTGELFGRKMPITRRVGELSEAKKKKSSLVDFLLPIITLFAAVVGAIVITGGWWVMGGQNSLLEALQNTNIYACFFMGGLIAAVATFIFLCVRKKIACRDLPQILRDGSSLMGSSIIMLMLIWTLSNILAKDLETGSYLARILAGQLNVLYLPAMIFVFSALISILMGTAWGTIGMLIPLALRMLPPFLHLPIPFELIDAPMVAPVLGAIISGAVIGNHISPIADVMLMSAASAGSYHIDLVKSQVAFALPTGASTAVAFLVAGNLVMSHGVFVTAGAALGAGIFCNILLLHLLQFVWQRRQK